MQNGQIFLFTGMLKLLPNADSLAVVLGHEMSHVILQHAVSTEYSYGDNDNTPLINSMVTLQTYEGQTEGNIF